MKLSGRVQNPCPSYEIQQMIAVAKKYRKFNKTHVKLLKSMVSEELLMASNKL